MPFTIADAGEPTASILYYGGNEPVAEFAAEELRSYVAAMSGAELPVENVEAGGELGETAAPSAVFVVPEDDGAAEPGGTAPDLSSHLTTAVERLDGTPDDTFVVHAEDAIVLTGTTHRGTLYAAYALLEGLGAEFFAPEFEFYEGHHEHVPDLETIEVTDPDTVETPDLAYRRKNVEAGWSFTADTLRALVDWMAKARLNVLACPADFSNVDRGLVTWDRWREELAPELEKRGTLLEVGGHGFDSFLPPEEYEDRPEWFVDGHNVFDVTNDRAIEAYVENVVEYLADRPEIDIFDAWPPDGASWPPAVTEAFDSIPNAYAHVVGALDDAVDEAFPDREVVVEAIAYASHLDPPDAEYMYDDSVLLDFAPINRGFGTPIDDDAVDANRRYADLLETWRDAFDGPLVVYEYYRRYAWHSLPVVFPRTVAADLDFYSSTGVDGLGMYSEPGDWLTFELTHSIVAAGSWNTDLDADAWVDEYLEARYGDVADRVGEYVDSVVAAAQRRFDPGRVDESDDESELATALELYRDAGDAVATARERADDGSSAEFLCGRLEANAEYAIADTEITYHERRGDEEAIAAARDRVRNLAEGHAFDGIVVHSQWTLDRYAEDESAGLGMSEAERVLFELYDDEW